MGACARAHVRICVSFMGGCVVCTGARECLATGVRSRKHHVIKQGVSASFQCMTYNRMVCVLQMLRHTYVLLVFGMLCVGPPARACKFHLRRLDLISN